MEPSSPSGNVSEPRSHRWANIFGTTIAVVTLTLPMVVTAYYSSQNQLNGLPPPGYTLTKPLD
jgi:ABC-type spermidine/putrescine transport system permease subunit II